MQENTTPESTVISESSTVSAVTPSTVHSSPNTFLVVLLSTLLFASVLIAGFFAFQTQKLVKELTVLKSEEKVVAVATTEPTIEPVTTDIPEVDSTANWKTYTNNYWGIVFKYPDTLFKGCQNYTTEKEGIRFWGPDFGCESGHDIAYKLGFVGYAPNKYFQPKSPTKVENIVIAGHKAVKKYYVYDELDGPASGLKQSVEVIINLDKGDIVLQQLGIDELEQKAFTQILSTFKFTN